MTLTTTSRFNDGRAYDYVVALRAVETIDFITARWARISYEVLANISSRIINEVTNISRWAYDISVKPPPTIEWEWPEMAGDVWY